MTTATYWACPGCGTTYSTADPDQITGHVGDCNYVDGSGQAYDVTIKWSVTHWYVATVKSSELAAATSSRPFTCLTGHVLDLDDDDPDAELPTYLDGLPAAPARRPETDGWEISHIYDARRDQPRQGPPEAATLIQAGIEVALADGQLAAIRAALAAFRPSDPQLAGDRDSAARLLEGHS